MLAFFKKIAARLRAHGPGYIVLLLRTEITQPRLRVTPHIRTALIRILQLLRRRVSRKDAWTEDCLQFFYDFSISPITFDFASYLAAAEVERRLRRLGGINVIFVMGGHDGVREETSEYDAAVNSEARRSRIRQILLPMLAFLPTIRGFVVCDTREQADSLISAEPGHIYPADYRVFLPRQPDKSVIHQHSRGGVPIWPMFRATEHGCRLIAEFLEREAKGRRPIVITLRNYDHAPERNSRNEDWLAFADSLDLTIYAPIFIHDSESVMRFPPVDFSRHIACEAASVNLEIRMALYEAAWLNMALMHGPTELCWYNERARYLLFISVGTGAVQSEASLIRNGHRVGADLDFATSHQRIVWHADEFAVLRSEFRRMEADLDRTTSASKSFTTTGGR
jgi:hypothetical protein